MLRRRKWEEFREAGLLWFVNMILHLFGWCIVVVIDEGKVIDVYPARTEWRGFSEKANNEGYIAVTKYLKNNIDELLSEVAEDENEEEEE